MEQVVIVQERIVLQPLNKVVNKFIELQERRGESMKIRSANTLKRIFGKDIEENNTVVVLPNICEQINRYFSSAEIAKQTFTIETGIAKKFIAFLVHNGYVPERKVPKISVLEQYPLQNHNSHGIIRYYTDEEAEKICSCVEKYDAELMYLLQYIRYSGKQLREVLELPSQPDIEAERNKEILQTIIQKVHALHSINNYSRQVIERNSHKLFRWMPENASRLATLVQKSVKKSLPQSEYEQITFTKVFERFGNMYHLQVKQQENADIST